MACSLSIRPQTAADILTRAPPWHRVPWVLKAVSMVSRRSAIGSAIALPAAVADTIDPPSRSSEDTTQDSKAESCEKCARFLWPRGEEKVCYLCLQRKRAQL